jgi:hypothetical protein
MGIKITLMFWPGPDDLVNVRMVAFSEVIGSFPVHMSHLHHRASWRAILASEITDWWHATRWSWTAWD